MTSDASNPGREQSDTGRPSLRQRRHDDTRRRILEACVEIEFALGGYDDPEAFTYARVAELADVSERTVYRMFPTKRELARAYVSERAVLFGAREPESISQWSDALKDVMRRWSERFPGPSSPPGAHTTPQDVHFPEARDERLERDRKARDEVRAFLGDSATDRQQAAVTAVLHSVASLPSVMRSAARWDLSWVEAGEAHAWALETLLDAINKEGSLPWKKPSVPS